MAGSDDDETNPPELIEAFAIFRQNIHKALEAFGDPDAPRTLEMERGLLHVVLARAGQFFAASFAKRFADKFFFEPASAFTDLNDGIVRPLMEPSPRQGRVGDPSDRWRARARVAVALDALMRSRQTRAADKIAGDYPGLCRLAGKKAGNHLPTTIIGWRQEFRKKRVKNYEAAELFAEGIRRIGELVGDPDGLKALATDQLEKADKRV
jgi:hypothetical protein